MESNNILDLKKNSSIGDLILINFVPGTSYFHTLGRAHIYLPPGCGGEKPVFHSIKGYLSENTNIDLVTDVDYIRLREENSQNTFRVTYGAIHSHKNLSSIDTPHQ